MSDYIFLFDLDSTITKVEILPVIAKRLPDKKMWDEMKDITERTMRGELPFEESFRRRIGLLSDIPVSMIRELIADIPLNERLADFIRENSGRCYMVTGNLDVWIEGLVPKLGLEGRCFCSRTTVKNDRIISVDEVMNKGEVIKKMQRPFVAVGDGDNDAEMIGAADVGIGFGGVREIAASVLGSATHAAYSEEVLCQFLRQLL
ncbi:MAG: HAD-IB family phosphatase [Butyrivibrio sp.]|nr:HAD-IB family phosphatase [Butyrivibrio sp.]